MDEMKGIKVYGTSALIIALVVGFSYIFFGCSGAKTVEQIEQTVIKEKVISVQVPVITDTIQLKNNSVADTLLSGVTTTANGDTTANFIFNKVSNKLAYNIKPAPVKTKIIDTTTIQYQKDNADSSTKPAPKKEEKYPFLSKVGLLAIGLTAGIIGIAGYYIFKKFRKI